MGAAAERVSKDVESPRDKLGEQTHSVGFAQAKDSLSDRVEGQRASIPFLAEVRKSHGIVREERPGVAAEEMQKPVDGQKYRQKLSVVDRKDRDIARPQA